MADNNQLQPYPYTSTKPPLPRSHQRLGKLAGRKCKDEVKEKTPRPKLPENLKTSLNIPSILIFRETDTCFKAKFAIVNNSLLNMGFRIRSSSLERYRITPNMGCIGSLETMNITVCNNVKLKGRMTFEEMKEDYFDIDSSPMPILETNQSALLSFWTKNTNGKLVERYRIEHLFNSQDNPGDGGQSSWVGSAVEDFSMEQNGDGNLEEPKVDPLAYLTDFKIICDWCKELLDVNSDYPHGEKYINFLMLFGLVMVLLLFVGLILFFIY